MKHIWTFLETLKSETITAKVLSFEDCGQKREYKICCVESDSALVVVIHNGGSVRKAVMYNQIKHAHTCTVSPLSTVSAVVIIHMYRY